MQIGAERNDTELDQHPQRVEGVATACFDLDELQWQRARYYNAALPASFILHRMHDNALMDKAYSELRSKEILGRVMFRLKAYICTAGGYSVTGGQICMAYYSVWMASPRGPDVDCIF